MTSKYQEPYCTPDQCDHSTACKLCARCCPCEDCGKLRAEEMDDNPKTTPVINVRDIKW